MESILLVAYIALGFWAAGKTIYANKILIGTWPAIFMRKFVCAFFLGWILIPIAIIKSIREK